MNIYFHVDESGSFDEGLNGAKASVVGGICSTHTSIEWEKLHGAHLAEFNGDSSPPAQFVYPGHYHCGELLAQDKPMGPALAGRTDRLGFTQSVYQHVLEKSLFGFISRNRGKRFEYSPQATYVMNLIAGLRFACETLALLPECPVSSLTIVIAQRTIRETSQGGVTAYMSLLVDFVARQLLIGKGQGVELARKLTKQKCISIMSGSATRDAGLIAADFVCCNSRYNAKIADGGILHVCQPDVNLLLGDYRDYYERQARELLDNGYYGSCLEFLCRYFPFANGAPDIGNLITCLQTEKNMLVLERELPALLAVIHSLISRRTEMPHAMAAAGHAAELLNDLAAKQILSSGNKNLWINLQLQALAELAACHNHTGAVGPQRAAESALTTILEANKKDAGLDPIQRRSFLLDVRNRNLNLLFNDYRFEEVYTQAEELAEERRGMTGGEEPDELMGKILGSQGQACAFMARLDPDWQDEAEKLFVESLKHFASGSRNEKTSINYLVTLLWQVGRYDDALDLLCRLSDWTPGTGRWNTLKSWLVAPHPETRAFESVNVLRLIAGFGGLDDDGELPELCGKLAGIADAVGTDHPYEQWWKWLGIICLQRRDYVLADRYLARCETLCDQHGFTMKTIGSSATLLRITTATAVGSKVREEALTKRFSSETDLLCRQSSGFSEYVRRAGGVDRLVSGALTAPSGDDQFWKLCSYLPFSYS